MALTERQLADRLIDVRYAAGLTQSEMATAIGVPRTAVSKIENGDRQVGALELVRWARAASVSVEYLIDEQ